MTADPKLAPPSVPAGERRDLVGDPRSFLQLLGDASDQFAKLLRSEMAVVRAEMAEKVVEAATGVAALIVALVVLLPALVLLLMALASWLVELGLRASLAQLIAALAGFVLCGV